MTGEQLKALESRLWKAADDLRANSKLTATEVLNASAGDYLFKTCS